MVEPIHDTARCLAAPQGSQEIGIQHLGQVGATSAQCSQSPASDFTQKGFAVRSLPRKLAGHAFINENPESMQVIAPGERIAIKSAWGEVRRRPSQCWLSQFAKETEVRKQELLLGPILSYQQVAGFEVRVANAELVEVVERVRDGTECIQEDGERWIPIRERSTREQGQQEPSAAAIITPVFQHWKQRWMSEARSSLCFC